MVKQNIRAVKLILKLLFANLENIQVIVSSSEELKLKKTVTHTQIYIYIHTYTPPSKYKETLYAKYFLDNFC